jgi:hypothetical protein
MANVNVSKLELMQTLRDIEDWTAKVRHLVELLPASVPMVVEENMQLPALLQGDRVPAAPDDQTDPEVARPLVYPEDLGIDGTVSPNIHPICPTQAQGSCLLGARKSATVQVKHLYQAMRAIEILAGICRRVLGSISDQDQGTVIQQGTS